jgi:excisionase family DNA binding protein
MQNIPIRDGKLLTEEQLANILETSVYNVRHLRHRKKIPFIRLGHRSIRFDLVKVRKALEKYEVEEVA